MSNKNLHERGDKISTVATLKRDRCSVAFKATAEKTYHEGKNND